MDFSAKISDLGLADTEHTEYKADLIGKPRVAVICYDRSIRASEPERSHIIIH